MTGNVPVKTDTIHPPFARYSHAVVSHGASRMLFVSGQLGITRDGHIPSGTADQAMQCFANIDAILAAAGMDRSSVVRISAFVTSREAFKDYIPVRDEWIKDLSTPPASTLVIVNGFTRPEFLVEVEITACDN